tara:strand:- start:135 stop:296 length:162 start_codon:yes stop_codon:yes gene_type:complete
MGHRARREDAEITEEIGCTAADHSSETVTIDATYAGDQVAPLAKNADLLKFIL